MSEPPTPAAQRGLAARAGITALNLLAPGLGLLRLGDRRGAAIAFLPWAGAIVVTLIVMAASGRLGWGALLATVLLPVAVWAGALGWSAWRSWRLGGEPIPLRRPWWAGGPAIAGLGVLAALAVQIVTGIGHRYYKPFYVPADSMAPTLFRNDRIVAEMRAPTGFRRGDVIVLRVGPNFYVKRVAGLPGDVIGMTGGKVILNGRAVDQRLLSEETYRSYAGDVPVRRYAEQFPGEARPHAIYDQGETAFDDVPAARVLPGHLYVLGDNRDLSADSRVPRTESGVEQLPISDVLGTALYYSYGPSHRSGERIGPLR